MKRFLLVFLAVIGLFSIILTLGAVLILGIGIASLGDKTSIPDQMVLEIDFQTGIVEDAPTDPLTRLVAEKRPVLRDILDAIAIAAEDDRVVGLLGHLGSASIGLAQIQELRDAVAQFRESGKPAIAFAQTFGEFSSGTGAYYLATSFDEIYLQPSGDLGLAGLHLEHPFLRGSFEKLGVTPRMDRRHEYKNAVNLFTETEFTEAHREASEAMLESLFGQIVRGISETRDLTEIEVRKRIDRGPFLAREALDAGFVDRLGYLDEVYTRLEELTEEPTEYLGFAPYLTRTGRPHESGPTIALIYGYGEIHRGESEQNLSGGATMGADTVAEAFRDAVNTNAVEAIVFRVSSPGGSYVASDAILRETQRARDAGIPVIVSMGDYAASGGYFVSMAADRILAQPGTLTGSIGVYGGKFVTRELFEKLGVTFDQVKTSANASMYSSIQDYSPSEWERFQAGLDRIYDDFTQKVSDSRRIDLEKVDEIARGRVWTGDSAVELGLADEIGGLDVAYRRAAEASGIDPDEGFTVRLFPREKTTWELLMEKDLFNTATATALFLLLDTAEELRPLIGMAERLGLIGEPGALRSPFLPREEGR